MAAALPIIGLVAGIGGTAMSAYGQYQSGVATDVGYKTEANLTLERGKTAEEEARDEFRSLLGEQRAKYAAAGVDISFGSPLLVMAETASQGELNAERVKWQAETEAKMGRFYGSQARKAGTIGGAGTFLSGLGQAATSYATMSKPKVTQKGR